MALTKKEKWCLGGLIFAGSGAGFTGGLLKDYPTLNTTAAWQYMLVGAGAAIAIFSIYKICACVSNCKIGSSYDQINDDDDSNETPTKS